MKLESLKSLEKFDKDFCQGLKDASTQKLYIIVVWAIRIIEGFFFVVNLRNVLTLGLSNLIP